MQDQPRPIGFRRSCKAADASTLYRLNQEALRRGFNRPLVDRFFEDVSWTAEHRCKWVMHHEHWPAEWDEEAVPLPHYRTGWATVMADGRVVDDIQIDVTLGDYHDLPGPDTGPDAECPLEEVLTMG